MVLETERVENVLVECIESRNERQFQYILHNLKINPNTKVGRFNGLSTFEKVLLTPKSRKFIEICICNGCDFYKKNSDGIYPLRYAIDSLCAENLTAILKPSEESIKPLCEDHFAAARHSKIINETLDGGNNYLHVLSAKMNEANCAELSQMIVTLVMNGCNINCSNEAGETAFYLLLKSPFAEMDLINFVIVNTRIDYHARGNVDIGKMMEDRGFAYQMYKQMDVVVDVDYMAEHISDRSGSHLAENIELWKRNSKDFDNEILVLLEVAIVKNLPAVVRTLMDHGAEINGISKKGKFNMTPAFLACTFGCHEVLKVLLTNKNLSFKSATLQCNLLHQLFSTETLDAVDRQKTFDLVIADPRCTFDIINQTDSQGQVPLYFACKYECDDIIKELLGRGAYIGYETVLNYIKKDTLQAFLDECVKCSSDINDRDCEVHIDYKFLMPSEKKQSEMTPIHRISTNPSLQELILHPVVSSFVLLKWRKIDFIVYFNIVLYFSFMIFLAVTIVNMYNVSKVTHSFDDFEYDHGYCARAYKFNNKRFDIPISEFNFVLNGTADFSITMLLYNNLNTTKRLYGNDTLDEKFAKRDNFIRVRNFEADEKWKFYFRQYFTQHTVSYWFGIIGLTFLAAYEVVQCAMSFRKYFFKPINWLDILLIAVSFDIFVENVDMGRANFKKCSAIMIMLMGGQSIQLFAKVSAFSLSLHMEILNKVCKTFLKTIAPYMVLITAFGMSFYALNYDEYNKLILRESNLLENGADTAERGGFASPFVSTISSVRMMLSDFDDITIKKEDHFQEMLFLVFMITISTVLLNLLNALAISDTNQMMEVAEFVELKKRISTVRSYENLFSFFKVTYANVFPDAFTIMITPTKDSIVKIKHQVQMSDNLTILMQKTGKISDYHYYYTNGLLRAIRQPLEFDEKLMTKIINFARNRQANQNYQAMNQTDNYKDEIYAMIRAAHDGMHKEIRVLRRTYVEKF